MLPKLLERAGNDTGEGSITGIYTVLVEGDDMNEPIADATRGILDGHFVLSRELAGKGHFPALSVLESVSRLMRELVPKAGYDLASLAREVLATYKASEDLITIGAYKAGANPKVDRAVAKIEALERFLQQPPSEVSNMEDSWRRLNEIFTTP
jgi:flagellum-specific ATP synthase